MAAARRTPSTWRREYVVRYSRTRPGLAAIALTTDSSILTAAGNDLGFEQVFAGRWRRCAARAICWCCTAPAGRAQPHRAARAARGRSVGTVAFLGRGGGALAAEVDEAIVIPSEDTAGSSCCTSPSSI
jgi:D-sedoheptulose 7-phosphate isomerase